MNDQAYRPVMAPCDSKIIACLLSFCGLRCARRDLRPAAASRRGLNGPWRLTGPRWAAWVYYPGCGRGCCPC